MVEKNQAQSMTKHAIRWIQRFHHFVNALSQLKKAIVLANKRSLSRLEKQGMIHAFEFTHELAWNMLKDFLENRETQNLTSHTYDQNTSSKIISSIRLP